MMLRLHDGGLMMRSTTGHNRAGDMVTVVTRVDRNPGDPSFAECTIWCDADLVRVIRPHPAKAAACHEALAVRALR